MKALALVPAAALALGLSGCCGLSMPNFPNAAAAAAAPAPAPAPAPVVKAAPAPAPAPVAAPAPAPAPAPKPAPEKVTIALEVKFDTAKSVVKPEYDSQLKKVADFLKAYPDTKAEIEGHTDNVGKPEYNKTLSQSRAAAVRQALIDRFGCDGSRLTAAGYGEEKPLAANDTPANRALNRRVVATFTGTK